MAKILNQNLVYKQFLKVEKADIEIIGPNGEKHLFERERLKREDAAAVLIHNTETGKIILTRQFRYAIHDRIKEPILEIMAGKVGEGEDPLETAIRESEEECGYKIPENQIEFISSFFASPGYTTEKYHLYYAKVTNSDIIGKGGGLEEEHEFIELAEIPLDIFLDLVTNNQLQDSKTFTAGLWLLDKKRNL
jgi:nudix-type nucleoside diphosphatase (YffH/AdpP family)